jgi:hypothetical protein
MLCTTIDKEKYKLEKSKFFFYSHIASFYYDSNKWEQEVVENHEFNNHETYGEVCESFLLEKDFDTSTYVLHNFRMNYQYRIEAFIVVCFCKEIFQGKEYRIL